MSRRWWSWARVGAAQPSNRSKRGLGVEIAREVQNSAGDAPLDDLGTWGLECAQRIPGEMRRWWDGIGG